MIEWLYGIDVAVFRFCNETLTFAPGDWFFPFITEVKNFYIFYALVLLSLMVFGKKKGISAVILLAVVILVSDQLSSALLKNLIGRIRPCAALEGVRLLISCGPGKSFPSSHAVNNFAAAVLFSHFYPKAAPYLYVFAGLVAYSRVYVGVHYPSDILGGALIGAGVAFLIVLLYQRLQKEIPFLRLTPKPSADSASAAS